MITPSTTVRLIAGVPVSPKHQPYFASATEQTAFFFSKTIANGVFDDFTYQRDNSSIIVPVNADDIYNVNYCMYRNGSYSDKWFYAYVTKVEYVSDYATRLTIETDPFQTWLFDFSMSKCLVEREHTQRYNSDGTPVINRIEENIDYGSDYITLKETQVTPYPSAPNLRWAVIACKKPITTNPFHGPRYAGTITTLTLNVIPIDIGTLETVKLNGVGMPHLDNFLELVEQNPDTANMIVSVSILPYLPISATVSIVSGAINITSSDLEINYLKGAPTYGIGHFVGLKLSPTVPTIQTDNRYSITKPAESKLLMYPYTYIECVDYKGNRLELKLEDFANDTISLRVFGSVGTENYTVYAISNYNNEVDGYSFSIIDNNTETLPVINNHTATYLQANANTLKATKQNAWEQYNLDYNKNVWATGAGATSGLLSMFGAELLGGAGQAVESLVNGYWSGRQNEMSYEHNMKNLLAQYKDAQRMPPNINAQGSSQYFNMAHKYNGIYLKWRQIKPEYMQRLTEYFKLFGYQVNQIKAPVLKTRKDFNYIKTTGATLTGNLPQNDRLDIQAMFDNGLTLWHNGNIGDYNVANEEV